MLNCAVWPKDYATRLDEDGVTTDEPLFWLALGLGDAYLEMASWAEKAKLKMLRILPSTGLETDQFLVITEFRRELTVVKHYFSPDYSAKVAEIVDGLIEGCDIALKANGFMSIDSIP